VSRRPAERVVARLTLPFLVTEDGRETVRRVKVMQSAEAARGPVAAAAGLAAREGSRAAPMLAASIESGTSKGL